MAELGIEGMTDLLEKVAQLEKVQSLKVLASAARSAVKPLVEAAKVLAPDIELQQSIGLAVIKPVNSDIVVSAGIKIKKRKIAGEIEGETGTADASWRWHLAEFGVPAYGTPASPYLRPAFDATKQQIVAIFKSKLAAAVGRAMKKQNPEGA